MDDKHHLVFCYIAKNGCSFWKRVFSILGGSRGNGTAVFNLSSTAIHRSNTLRTLSRPKGPRGGLLRMYHSLQSSQTFLFVRDPYERLFSGYVDKVFSPCGFPGATITSIISKFRDPREEGRSSRKGEGEKEEKEEGKGKGGKGGSSRRCGGRSGGVTFTEFLRYVTNSRGVRVDGHFRRQYETCLPCHLAYGFVGKMETFHRDAKFILERAGVEPQLVLGPDEAFEETSDVNILLDVARRSFDTCQRADWRGCVSRPAMLLRVWTTFQVSGDPL